MGAKISDQVASDWPQLVYVYLFFLTSDLIAGHGSSGDDPSAPYVVFVVQVFHC